MELVYLFIKNIPRKEKMAERKIKAQRINIEHWMLNRAGRTSALQSSKTLKSDLGRFKWAKTSIQIKEELRNWANRVILPKKI